MAVETITEHGEPEREPDAERDDFNLPAQAEPTQADAEQQRADADLQAHAAATIKRLLEEHPAVAKEIKDTLRTRVHLRELAGRTNQAEVNEADTEQQRVQPGRQARSRRPPGPRLRAGPRHRRRPGHPRCRPAELGRPGVRPQLRRDLARHVHPGRRVRSGRCWASRSPAATRGGAACSSAVVTVAYLALLGLRTEFLITVSSDSLPVALLQSALLTAISAGLVLCGSAVLARTRFLSHSRARAAARRAAQAADDARAAQRQAAEKLQRHIGSLHHMLLPWALRSAAPEGVDHANWDAALDQAIRALFSTTT